MSENLQNKKRKISKTDLLAAYQIFGGLMGLCLNIFLINSFRLYHVLLILIYIISIGLYTFSIIAGYKIFKNLKTGLKLSRINLLLQVFSFSIAGYAFQYVSGIDFSFHFFLSEAFRISATIDISTWRILLGGETGIDVLSINILAIVLLVFTQRQLKKLNREEEENITGIGKQPTA